MTSPEELADALDQDVADQAAAAQPGQGPRVTVGQSTGGDLARFLNDMAGKATGEPKLPAEIRFGEAWQSVLAERTGHSDVPPLYWAAATTLLLGVVTLWKRRPTQAPQSLGFAAPG